MLNFSCIEERKEFLFAIFLGILCFSLIDGNLPFTTDVVGKVPYDRCVLQAPCEGDT
jgi:hypothetical protein